ARGELGRAPQDALVDLVAEGHDRGQDLPRLLDRVEARGGVAEHQREHLGGRNGLGSRQKREEQPVQLHERERAFWAVRVREERVEALEVGRLEGQGGARRLVGEERGSASPKWLSV